MVSEDRGAAGRVGDAKGSARRRSTRKLAHLSSHGHQDNAVTRRQTRFPRSAAPTGRPVRCTRRVLVPPSFVPRRNEEKPPRGCGKVGRRAYLQALFDFDGVQRTLGVALLAFAHDDAATADGAAGKQRRPARRHARNDGAYASRMRGSRARGTRDGARDGAHRGSHGDHGNGTDHGDSRASRGRPTTAR